MPEVMLDSVTEQIMEEHRELSALVAGVRGYLELPRPEVGDKGFHTWSVGLSERLVQLHDQLFRHFRSEEEDGFFDELSSQHPRAVHEIDTIVHEHPEILAEIRELMAAVLAYSEAHPLEGGDSGLRRRLVTLLDRLDRHEKAENDLILRLDLRDIGPGD